MHPHPSRSPLTRSFVVDVPRPALLWPGLAWPYPLAYLRVRFLSHTSSGPVPPGCLLIVDPPASSSNTGPQIPFRNRKPRRIPTWEMSVCAHVRKSRATRPQRTTNLAVDSSLLFSATCMRIDFSAGFASVCRHACYKDCGLSASSPSRPTIGERSSNKPLGRVTPPQDQDQDHRQASCPVRP